MKVKMAVIADAANISREGKLNVTGIFDAVFSSQVPVRHASMVVVVCLEVDPSERGRPFRLDMDLINEDGKSIQKLPPLNFVAPDVQSPNPVTVRAIANVTDLIFPKYGPYTLSILVDNHALDHVRVSLQPMNHVPQQPPEPDEQGQ